jgi:DNA-binding response OmpR family regulator
MINVAVASAQRELARKLRTCLVEWGYRPWEMEREIPLQFQLQERGCDVLLLDLETPIGKNPAAAAQIKKMPEHRHLAVLGILGAEQMPPLEFNWGLDDFVWRGAEPHIWLAQLQTKLRFLLWRLNKLDSNDVLRVRNLEVNLASYQVTVDNALIYLTYKEFELLRFLLSNRGRVFTRDALLRHVWGDEYLGGTRTVDVHIRRLRGKIGPQFDELIQTVRHVGYKMVKD